MFLRQKSIFMRTKIKIKLKFIKSRLIFESVFFIKKFQNSFFNQKQNYTFELKNYNYGKIS